MELRGVAPELLRSNVTNRVHDTCMDGESSSIRTSSWGCHKTQFWGQGPLYLLYVYVRSLSYARLSTNYCLYAYDAVLLY